MIVFKDNVTQYLDDLVFDLFDNEYFGFIEGSDIFVDKLIDFIKESISTFPARKTPIRLKSYGSNYIFYKSNQRTTWYVFFEEKDMNYVITNIINNNSEVVKWL